MCAYTVGMYSPGKALVVYDIRRHVCRASAKSSLRDNVTPHTLPTAPSPVTTHCVLLSVSRSCVCVEARCPPSSSASLVVPSSLLCSLCCCCRDCSVCARNSLLTNRNGQARPSTAASYLTCRGRVSDRIPPVRCGTRSLVLCRRHRLGAGRGARRDGGSGGASGRWGRGGML